MHKDPIICIMGPTGVGKTSLALFLSKVFPLEVVSVDSRQIYRGMDIGTGKPTSEQLGQVRHHLIDIRSPDQSYSAADFKTDADEAISIIRGRQHHVIMAGGTGLYFKAAVEGLFDQPPISAQIRQKLKAEVEGNNGGELHKRLATIDPEAAAKIHPNDLYRTIRALEVYYGTKKSISSFRKDQLDDFDKLKRKFLKIGLKLDRSTLYERINRRVDQMMESGFLEEVRHLVELGYEETLPALQGIGYRQLMSYLNGKCDLGQAISITKRDTRHYAKRQITWFNGDSQIRWFHPEDVEGILVYLKSVPNFQL